MADIPSPASTVPQKRALPADDTQPRTKLKEKNVQREAREKKDSWRKKEALQSGFGGTAGSGGGGGSTGKQTGANTPKNATSAGSSELPGLVRYRLPAPQYQDYYGHKAPPMVPVDVHGVPDDFFAVNDHPMNRRGFRYSPCEASQLLPSLAYRGTEYEPYGPRINFEDMNGQIYVNKEGTAITNPKGWRMARANVGVREGDWYYECKITNGITPDSTEGGHVRIGWARREAPLDAPVGFDAYSYGLRDQGCQKLHMSRPTDFVTDTSFCTGDVLGLHISLPSLALQRDLSGDPMVKASDVIRDRLPIRFKNQLWFEHFEYQPTKEFEDMMNPAPNAKPSHPPRTLPGSFIRVYKNGTYIGTPFEDLFAFLPPASKPLTSLGGRELDDGALGYYPAVSVYKGGAAEVNFGPDWIHPPAELGEQVRGIWERYDEQIAEDVMYDLVDEVDLLFTTGGMTVDDDDAKGAAADTGAGRKEQIKEMVMDDE